MQDKQSVKFAIFTRIALIGAKLPINITQVQIFQNETNNWDAQTKYAYEVTQFRMVTLDTPMTFFFQTDTFYGSVL